MSNTTNLTPRQTSITCDGFDITQLIARLDGTTTAVGDDGLIITTGTAILKPIFGNPLMLDPLKNKSTWRRGNKLIATDFVTSSRIPVIGTLFIETAKFNDTNQELTLKLGCSLCLSNKLIGAQQAICIPPLSSKPVAEVLESLLQKAGVPAIGDLSALDSKKLMRSVQTTDSESLLRIAGQLAYEFGFMLWQDEDGEVQLIDMLKPGATGSIKLDRADCLTYDSQDSDGDQPPVKLSVSGTRLIAPDNKFKSSDLEIIPEGINRTESVVDGLNWEESSDIFGKSGFKVDRAERQTKSYNYKSDVLSRLSPAIFTIDYISEYYKEDIVEKYEPLVEASEGNCTPVDEGRLLERISTIREAKGLALQSYYIELSRLDGSVPQKSPKDIVAATHFLIDSSRIEETWEYDLPEFVEDKTAVSASLARGLKDFTSPDADQKSYGVTYTKRTYDLIGRVFPQIADPFLGKEATGEDATAPVQSPINANPQELVEVAFEHTKWYLGNDKQTWTSKTVVQQIAYQLQPEAIQAGIDNDTVSAQEIFDMAFALTDIPQTEEPRSGAPVFARFPQAEAFIEVPYELELNFSDADQELGLTDSIDVCAFCNDKDLAADIGWAYAKRKYMRSFSRQISANIAYVLGGNKQVPLKSRCDVSFLGNTSSFALDAMSVVFSPEEGSVFSMTGLLIGQEDRLPTNAPITAPNGEESYQVLVSADGNIVTSVNANGLMQVAQADSPYGIVNNGDGTATVTDPSGNSFIADIDATGNISFVAYESEGSDAPSTVPFDIPLIGDLDMAIVLEGGFVLPLTILDGYMDIGSLPQLDGAFGYTGLDGLYTIIQGLGNYYLMV